MPREPRDPKDRPVPVDEPAREESADRPAGPSRKIPYYEGYFGTGEEEGVERERDDAEEAKPRPRGKP